jgi:serine protease
MFPRQWGLPHVGFVDAWALVAKEDKKPVRVGIIDTGVIQHEDLPLAAFYQGFGECQTDRHGHGTSVAGILCATRNNKMGIAGAVDCELFVYRVIDDKGWNWQAYYGAVRDCRTNGVKVVNLSLGGSEPDCTEEFLISLCIAAGVIVVAAAGNHGRRGNPEIHPAALGGVVAVSGVNERNELARNSSFGDYVDIAAPADSWSTTLHDNYHYVEGTSFAAPLVTGAVALALSVRPHATPEKILELLRETANDPTGNGKTPFFGHGVLDVAGFMREILKI